MNQSPAKPWLPGKQHSYTSFRVVLNICQDGQGRVWSDHEFLSPEDEAVVLELPQGGVPQIAHALLTEAVRREVFTGVLIRLSQDAKYLTAWLSGDAEKRQAIEGALRDTALHVLTKTCEKMLPGAVSGVLDMLVRQYQAPLSPPREV